MNQYPISDLIEGQPLGRLQYALVFALFVVLLLDGLDLQLLAYAAPVITAEWAITQLELAPALSATLFGTATGALIGGGLSDRFGRRWTLIGSVVLFGLATILCSMATDVPQLAVMRFIGGLGFGACFPSVVALTAEWLPRRVLSQATGAIQLGVPAGAMVGALLSGSVIPELGWRASFVFGGVPPLVLALGMVLWLPESPTWAARRDNSRRRVGPMLEKAWPGLNIAEMDLSEPARANDPNNSLRQAIRGIFTLGSTRRNVGIWLAFFANGLAAYGLWTWGTTLLTVIGLSLEAALTGAFWFGLASLVAVVPVALAAARWGTLRVMMVLIAVTGSTSLLLAVSLLTSQTGLLYGGQLVVAGMALMGMGLSGLQVLLYVFPARAYDTDCRATGAGLAATVGRVGGIVTVLAGGALLSALPSGYFFVLLAGFMVAVALGAAIFDRHVPARSQSADGPPGQTQ